MPGTWRLVAALCRHGQWPESSWPGVLQSLVEANHWLASAQLSAFVEESDSASVECAFWGRCHFLSFCPLAVFSPPPPQPQPSLIVVLARVGKPSGWTEGTQNPPPPSRLHTSYISLLPTGYGSKFNHPGTAGFSPWFHLPGQAILRLAHF